MENPPCGLIRRNSSSSPLYKVDKIFIRSAADPGPLRPWRVASSPVEIPHGVASILERLHPRIMHIAMTSIMVNPDRAKELIRHIK